MEDRCHLAVRHLGRADYLPVWRAMQAFTDARAHGAADELWLVEHPPVYTLGRNARSGHLRDAGGIPVVEVDRGGQVTYHGPGQLVAYVLIDLRRRGVGVRWLVEGLEEAVVALLESFGIAGRASKDAPGVYVDGAKIASLGLRVRRGCSYHGLSLNVDPDLAPFRRIDPCGYRGLAVTSLRELGLAVGTNDIASRLAEHIGSALGCRPGELTTFEPPFYGER